MTTENTAAPVAQVASTAQDPSTQEVKQADAQPQDGNDQSPPEKAKEEMVPLKRLNRLRAALGNEQRQLQEEKRLREAVEKRLADYEAKINPLADKPNQDNFDSLEDYADALADWKLSQKEKEKTKSEVKEQTVEERVKEQLEFEKTKVSFQSKEAEFRAKEPNYDKAAATVNQFMRLANPQDPSFKAFAQTVMNADNPPELINYLGNNPNDIISLFGKAPAEVEDILMDIIDNKLGAPKAQSQDYETTEEEQPKALPTPPTALKGSAKVRKTIDQMSGTELLNKYMPRGR